MKKRPGDKPVVLVDAAGGDVFGQGETRLRIFAQASNHPVRVVESHTRARMSKEKLQDEGKKPGGHRLSPASPAAWPLWLDRSGRMSLGVSHVLM